MRILIATAALAASALVASSGLADELRNVKTGELVPPFELSTLDGKTIGTKDLRGQVAILVFLSAQQRSSELAAPAAHSVYQEMLGKKVTLVFATADTSRLDYFRRHRDRTNVHAPLALDFNRTLYGALGLIVLPTTVVIDKEGVLRHVISSYKADYEHVLRTYVRHTLGQIDDAQLQEELSFRTFSHDRLESRLARHRAAARLLRESRLLEDAERELKIAFDLQPTNTDVRLDLASLYLATDKIAEARELVDQVLLEQPDHRRAKLLLGAVLFHEDRLDEADALLQHVLLLNPDPIYTHYYLGLIRERRGEPEQAVTHFKEALSRLLADRGM